MYQIFGGYLVWAKDKKDSILSVQPMGNGSRVQMIKFLIPSYVRLYPLTYSDQIWHGNTSRGWNTVRD